MSHRSVSRLILVCLTLVSAGVATAQATTPPRSKESVVRELMALTGAGEMGKQVMVQMLPPLKKAIPDVPEGFWEGFMAEVNTDEMVDLVVPVYLKHFSQEELETLVAFYKTPIGRKLLAETPAVMQECMAAGQAWGREVAERAMKKAKRGGAPKS